MKTLRFAIPFVFLATAPLGFALGGAWAFLTLIVTPTALCVLDGALGAETEGRGSGESPLAGMLPRLYVGAQIAVIVWAAMAVRSPRVGWLEVVGLTLSVGVSAGVFGMLAAHELVHRREQRERALGLTMLAFFGYMHFRVAHLHGHHVRAATFEDSTSARLGEGAYRFIVRAVVGQVAEAWMFEARALRLRGRRTMDVGNRLLWYFAVEAAIAAAFAALGLRAFGFWFCQAAIAVIMLELFNYIAHYGLRRGHGTNGRLERMGPQHSWNVSRRMNNAALFNMGRHSDHHRRPTLAYQRLEREIGAPELPTGYAGAILLALIPPLWRRVMDPRADAWAPGR